MFERIVVGHALSLIQPWATLVVIGAKRIETRSWSTSRRGWLGIHASKGFPDECKALCDREPFRRRLQAWGYKSWRDLPTGALVGAGELVDVQTAPNPLLAPKGSDELAFGDHSPGRKLWKFDHAAQLLTPAPMRGAMGIWRLDFPRAIEEFKVIS